MADYDGGPVFAVAAIADDSVILNQNVHCLCITLCF